MGAPSAARGGRMGVGKSPVFPDGCCKFRVRKAANDACVAPMVGAVDLESDDADTGSHPSPAGPITWRDDDDDENPDRFCFL